MDGVSSPEGDSTFRDTREGFPEATQESLERYGYHGNKNARRSSDSRPQRPRARARARTTSFRASRQRDAIPICAPIARCAQDIAGEIDSLRDAGGSRCCSQREGIERREATLLPPPPPIGNARRLRQRGINWLYTYVYETGLEPILGSLDREYFGNCCAAEGVFTSAGYRALVSRHISSSQSSRFRCSPGFPRAPWRTQPTEK